MANAADKTAVMTENLHDMGFDDRMTAECLELVRQKRYAELERLLKSYRQTLLDSVHKYNDRIDCLDYFTYKLKNGGM
ncbi:MAG: hypothetical protein J6M48_09270 [Ruminococcus sp.]|nr:hypothetical protein [Ruminococcus sp.]